jgi:prepilin peptidase CpaA
MPRPFFPHSLVLAWAFYVVLVSITLIATYTDLRYLRIPKWLTLPTVVSGVLVNVLLGALTTDEPRGSFLIGGEGGFLGALDGLLLSVCGFLTGLGLFLVMFVLNTCRGGDVKLFAGVGAWVGPMLSVYLLIGTIFAVVVMGFTRLVWKFATHGFGRTFKDFTLKAAPGKQTGKKRDKEPKMTRRRLTAYSPAVAVSAALLLLWFFRLDLQLPTAQGKSSTETTQTARR